MKFYTRGRKIRLATLFGFAVVDIRYLTSDIWFLPTSDIWFLRRIQRRFTSFYPKAVDTLENRLSAENPSNDASLSGNVAKHQAGKNCQQALSGQNEHRQTRQNHQSAEHVFYDPVGPSQRQRPCLASRRSGARQVVAGKGDEKHRHPCNGAEKGQHRKPAEPCDQFRMLLEELENLGHRGSGFGIQGFTSSRCALPASPLAAPDRSSHRQGSEGRGSRLMKL